MRTLIAVSSSWNIDGGFVYDLGAGEPPKQPKGYRCTVCNERGHNVRTCPLATVKTDPQP